MTENGFPAETIQEIRTLAEEVLQKRGFRDHKISELRTMGISKLIHELRVYQIELEMQNEELRKTQVELQASRDRYADLYDFAPIGYFTVSHRGIILAANLTGANMLETGRADLIGKPFSRFVTSDTQDIWYLHQRKIFDTKTRQNCELRLAKKRGTEFYARLDSMISADEKGNYDCFRTAASDISDLKQAEAALRESEKKLVHMHKMKAVGTFAGGIAHNFNNMLSIIIGNTELALGEISTWNSIHGFLEEIMTASVRAKEMIKQLLSFTFSANTKRYPICIEPVVEEALDLLRTLIPKNIRVYQHMGNETSRVMTDPPLIHLILINLGSNAAHAMEPVGGDLTVSISNLTLTEDIPSCLQRLKPGPYVKLTVTDTGCGMRPEIMDRIFDPYFTTKDIGKGTGLGLSIVHGIVQSHDGGISVCSEPGKGTEFIVYLPAAPNREKEEQFFTY